MATPQIPRKIARYELLERIGEGGMGVVYRARDRRLDREVALKVLRVRPGQEDPARERFRREASALSRLHHPSINTVFDFDSENGLDFLVLELVEGERLDRRLASGPLDEAAVVHLGIEMADALAAAHEQGIIHRDLKPGNVIVTAKGGVKLLDFGLALLRPGGAASQETRSLDEAGQVAGTLAYMSPEQLLGREVDERSDLFALGVLLYEMATAGRPFEAPHPTALTNEILHSPATRPSAKGVSLPPALESVILSLLEKDPARRPASAAEVALRLRAVRDGETSPAAPRVPATPALFEEPPGAIRSLAVLPLENITRDPDQEYFADGMTEALIADLAQIGALRVVSRTSVMQYKGVRVPLPEIAKALHVDAVVEGSVVRSGDRVRITAQLIEAATDRHLWARSYDGDLRDVLALQSDVAKSIAEEIRVQVSPHERVRLSRSRRVDPGAFEAYLRGRHYWNRRTEPGIRRGIEYFQEAIGLDPLYAQAFAGLAQAYDTLGGYSFLPPADAYTRARAAANRALEIDETLSEAHTALGGVLQNYEWDWTGAEAAFRRAIALDPNSAIAYQWYSDFLSAMDRSDEACAAARRAVDLDPLSLIINMTVGTSLFYARRYEEAIEQQRRTLDLDPSFAPAYRSLGGAYEQLGRYPEAIEAYTRAASLTADRSATSLLAHAYAVSGRLEEARRLLRELEGDRDRYVSPYSIAAIHAALGERDRAFEDLNRAFEIRDRGVIWLQVSPRLDPLRSDPRFTDLVRRMKFPAR